MCCYIGKAGTKAPQRYRDKIRIRMVAIVDGSGHWAAMCLDRVLVALDCCTNQVIWSQLTEDVLKETSQRGTTVCHDLES